jgi:hypothetical protein
MDRGRGRELVATITAFYADTSPPFRRGSSAQDGNVQVPFELVITARLPDRPSSSGRRFDRISAATVLAILPVEASTRIFRRVPRRPRLQPGRIRAASRAVVTSPSPEDDAIIDAMMQRGELRRRDLLKAPDGSPTFWVLETGAP